MCGSRGAVSFGTPLLGHPLRGLASLGGYSRAHIPLRGIMPRRSLQIPSPIHVLQSILRVRSTASDAKRPTPLPPLPPRPLPNHNPTKRNGRGESAATLQIFNGSEISSEGLGDQLFATVVVVSSIKHDGFATYCKVHNSHINPATTKHASVLRVVPWRRDSRICARVGWFMAL